MIFYITATINGKIVLRQNDPFPDTSVASQVIARNMDEVAQTLRSKGFDVVIRNETGYEDVSK